MQFDSEVTAATDPTLNGRVTMHIPNLYERISIGKRKAELCAPVLWENMPPEERSLTEALATLEFVIDTAPEGWFEEDPSGQKLLNPGLILQTNESLFWGVYATYVVNFNRFRGDAIQPVETSQGTQPASGVGSSQSTQSGPTGLSGHPTQ